MAHEHAHHHSGALAIPLALRRRLALCVAPVIVATLVGLIVLWPHGRGPDFSVFSGDQNLVKGTVTALHDGPCQGSPEGSPADCQELRILLSGGPDEGKTTSLELGGAASGVHASVGDKIVLGYSSQDGQRQYYFADFDRDFPILILFVLFGLAALALGRWSGLRALVALVLSLLALVWFVIPSILRGHSPIAVAIVGSAFIMLVVLYVTGGINTQSTVGVLGTMASLALIGALAWGFVVACHFTGLADEDAAFLQAAASSINLQGLLLGGIIIGSLGVLDDMTVTQVSAVWELRRADPTIGARELYSAAERIGRDHIASTVNTLVLAYAGASLPLMIFFTQSNLHLSQILTSEVIAVEVVRTLVGSIGLVASVPITTALAAYVVTRHVGGEVEPAEAERPALAQPTHTTANGGLRDTEPMGVTLNPYINFRGQARAALEFYHSVFGGELNIMSFAEMPAVPTGEDEADHVMHGQLNADNGIVLMCADVPASMDHQPFNGSISLSGDDEATLRGYYEKLVTGGTTVEPLAKAPWGDTFGMCLDKFGVHWLVNIAGAQ
jgi:uncharacterized membrane protein/uncharacterized glyoxalase superfamily protein PhnB